MFFREFLLDCLMSLFSLLVKIITLHIIKYMLFLQIHFDRCSVDKQRKNHT